MMAFSTKLSRSAVLLFGLAAFASFRGHATLPIYTDSLVNGFQDWGWASHTYTNTQPVHSGADSVSVTIDSAYAGLQIYHPDLNSSPYSAISFWINGGTNGGQKLQVYGLLHVGAVNNSGQNQYYSLGTLATNTWQQVIVPLASLGIANRTNFTGFVIQDRLGAVQPTFYLDDVRLEQAAPSTLSINATQSVRAVDARWFGVNTAIWDGNFDTATTISLLTDMGTRILRGPGGSLSDEYHWVTDTSRNNAWQWQTHFGSFVHIATNIGAQAFITVNYGSGSSNEAAAWVAFANGSPTNTLSLGVDRFGTNWHTAGYWAALRAAAPLGQDDGKNFLRLSRPAPLGFKYWEIGNECYGTWEYDINTNAPYHTNEAWTYAMRARDYFQFMKAVDPTIKAGVMAVPGEDSYANGYLNHPASNPRTSQTHNGWTPVMLSTLKSLGMTPDFLVHHRYPEYSNPSNPAGGDSDSFLLQCSTGWATDAADLRQQITDYFGAGGTNIELVCTENNSDAGASGKQSTSLINGLYYADSLAQLMNTEFNAFVWWDLRNSTDTSGWFDNSLYGWRTFGDLGMVNGLNTRLPAFYAAKLMQFFAQPGDTIAGAASNDPLLSGYAARGASGALTLLVINKDQTTNASAQVAIANFTPSTVATFRSYGIPQDEAARTGMGNQDLATNSVVLSGPNFVYPFPPYSLSLITLAPTAPSLLVLPQGSSPGQVLFQLQGQQGVRYYLQSSTNLAQWSTVLTNTLSNSKLNITNTIPAGSQIGFWRAVWQP